VDELSIVKRQFPIAAVDPQVPTTANERRPRDNLEFFVRADEMRAHSWFVDSKFWITKLEGQE
jgi:hypothetical protein